MRPLLVLVALLAAATAHARDWERFVQRTPPRPQVPHTMDRAGNPLAVKPHAVPSVTARDAGGYVGGARLHGNNVFARGAGAAKGPLRDGTFGTDYAGLHVRPGRVFLAPSYDPSVGPTVARSYRTDGPFPPDVFVLRPLRKAILEKKEVTDERRHGGE